MPRADVPPAEAKAATTSLGDLIGDVAQDLTTLMRQEVELAKAEFRESATRAGKGAGMYGGAGAAGLFALLFLSLALWWALGASLVGFGWSAVIVAVIWAIVAAVLAFRAKKEMEAVRGMPRTAETVKKIPPSLKPSEEPR
nr:phage holin family protein [Sinomonas mesophila]